MKDFKMQIAEKIAEVTSIDVNEIKGYIEIPKDANMGDYAFPCFSLAKSLRKAPQMIATEIKEKIDITDTDIETVEIVGGYLNFTISKNELAKLKVETYFLNNFEAPIKADTKIGFLTIKCGDEILKKAYISTKNNIEKKNYKIYYQELLKNMFNFL